LFTPIVLDARNPGPLTGTGNNTYLLLGSDGSAALIDAGVGHPDHLQALDHQLTTRAAHLSLVLVTHAHPDHASGAAALHQRYPHAVFCKYPWPAQDDTYGVPWRPLADGEHISAAGTPLVAIRTAGHSPDHLVLHHEPSNTVFAGDLIIPRGSVMIDIAHGGNLKEYLDSLQRVRALKPARLLPAHGPEVLDPERVLTTHYEHRRLRERQVIAALSGGRDTVHAIADSIYDGLGAALMAAARENVRAHLEKLRSEGAAAEQSGRWILIRKP